LVKTVSLTNVGIKKEQEFAAKKRGSKSVFSALKKSLPKKGGEKTMLAPERESPPAKKSLAALGGGGGGGTTNRRQFGRRSEHEGKKSRSEGKKRKGRGEASMIVPERQKSKDSNYLQPEGGEREKKVSRKNKIPKTSRGGAATHPRRGGKKNLFGGRGGQQLLQK